MKRPLSYLLIAFLCFAATAASAEGAFDATPLCIVTQGKAHHVKIEIAHTEQEKAMGLMFRTSLPKGQGMLFIYDVPREVAMWMKNTYIPLDMAFIKANGRVANVIEGAEPQTLTPRPSKGRVMAVLELPAGQAETLGLQAGDGVFHPSMTEKKDMPDVCGN